MRAFGQVLQATFRAVQRWILESKTVGRAILSQALKGRGANLKRDGAWVARVKPQETIQGVAVGLFAGAMRCGATSAACAGAAASAWNGGSKLIVFPSCVQKSMVTALFTDSSNACGHAILADRFSDRSRVDKQHALSLPRARSSGTAAASALTPRLGAARKGHGKNARASDEEDDDDDDDIFSSATSAMQRAGALRTSGTAAASALTPRLGAARKGHGKNARASDEEEDDDDDDIFSSATSAMQRAEKAPGLAARIEFAATCVSVPARGQHALSHSGQPTIGSKRAMEVLDDRHDHDDG